MHSGQIDAFEVPEYSAPGMDVIVHQAGNDRMTAEIRQFRLRASQSADCNIASDRDKRIAVDGKRLWNAESRIYRDDFSVKENLIRCCCGLLLCKKAADSRS